ncbi:MAG TPA: regulatory protein RecX [Actinomycetota bacterium]|nr:regulatory protein RecX [Actinomycetota bacterium]
MAEEPRTPVKDRALRLLAVRARSREELHRRLVRAGYPEADVEAALDDLGDVGLVDDERFAREVASREIGRRLAGDRGAVGALRRAGIDRETAERAVGEAGGGDEESRAERLARARAGRFTDLDRERAYRRLAGYLQRRGYHPGVVHAVCRRVLGEDEP